MPFSAVAVCGVKPGVWRAREAGPFTARDRPSVRPLPQCVVELYRDDRHVGLTYVRMEAWVRGRRGPLVVEAVV